MLSPTAVIGTFLIGITATIGASVARADALYDEVAKMMRDSWSTSFKTRATADAQFDQVKRVAGGKLDAYYAYTLVLIKQHRYPQAARAIEELARVDSDNVYFLRTKAWLDALTKEYSASLRTLDQLGQGVSKLDEKEESLRREMAGFLGRMLGFLEGPAGDPATVGTVAATKTKIAERLSPDEQSLLNNESRTVVARYKEMIGESEDAEREARDDAEQDRDQLLEDLERQRQRMEERRKELGPQYEKLRDEAKAEIEQFAKEERPFLQQLAQLDQQATVVRRELILINDQLSRLRSSTDREKDPIARGALINESSRLSILARRYDADYVGLERRAGSINLQLAEIRGRAQQARQKYAAEFGQIETELSDIEKQSKRNDLDQRKSQRTRISGSTRLTRAIEAKASALGTYENYSLEAEKERVLSALKE